MGIPAKEPEMNNTAQTINDEAAIESEVVAYLQAHGAIKWTEFNTPSSNDQKVFEGAKLVPSEKYRIRIIKGGRVLELTPVVGMGATLCGWTDRHPYEVVKVVSDKCLEVRAMHAEGGLKKDHTFLRGGFVGHIVDQHSAQEWVVTSNPEAPVIRIRLGAKGWKDKNGQTFRVGDATKFHDYNF